MGWDDVGVAKLAKDAVGSRCGLVIAGLEFNRIRISVQLEPEQLNVTMHGPVGLPDGQRRMRRVVLDRRMLKQHLLLKFDPQRSLTGLAVGHAPEELSDLCAQLPEYILAAGQRNAADKMQPVTL
jgi:hypothetical protein